MSPLMALNGHGAMSALYPLCAPKRTLVCVHRLAPDLRRHVPPNKTEASLPPPADFRLIFSGRSIQGAMGAVPVPAVVEHLPGAVFALPDHQIFCGIPGVVCLGVRREMHHAEVDGHVASPGDIDARRLELDPEIGRTVKHRLPDAEDALASLGGRLIGPGDPGIPSVK